MTKGTRDTISRILCCAAIVAFVLYVNAPWYVLTAGSFLIFCGVVGCLEPWVREGKEASG